MWTTIRILVCMAAIAMLPWVGQASASLKEAGKVGRVATARELGFKGQINETRDLASSIAARGSWQETSFRNYPEIERMAEFSPLRLREFGPALQEKATHELSTEPPQDEEELIEEGEELAFSTGAQQLPTAEYPVTCRTSGHRVKLVYAYPQGYQPTEPWEALQLWTAMNRANGKMVVESLRSSELRRMVTPYVDCYPPGHVLAGWPTITVAEIPAHAPTIPLGLREVLPFPTQANSLRYLTYYVESDPKKSAAGVASVNTRTWRSAAGALANEWETRWAIVFRPYWFSHVSIHELFHTLGAVDSGPPMHWASSGRTHCNVAYDIMCHDDGGSRGHLYPTILCPDKTPEGLAIDCLQYLYFRADHGEGLPGEEWLDDHWNVIGAENRFMHATPPWDYSVP